jgi:hypothetical protein
MDILHLSDLHVTEKNETLPGLWLHVEPALGSRRFDYVLVTGDLTQQAAPAEYDSLGRFLRRSILPFLRERNVNRIVLVPGNHDVDWSAPIAEPLSLSLLRRPEDVEQLASKLREHWANPDSSNLRVHIGTYGHIDVLSLNRARYETRFANFQAFIDSFYGRAMSVPHSSFSLLGLGKPIRQWSAHVFTQGHEKVAFYGFNSCASNDAYWHGALIDQQALVEAKEHARSLDDDVLRVAVWHHGFSSERGRPDALGLADIGRLHAAGFRIGFHGHVHKSEGAVAELLSDRFVRVSTGSIGAGQTDRQDNVGRQFSVVTLHPTRATVDVYEQKGEAKQYVAQASLGRRFHLRPDEQGSPLARAERHERTWTIDDDGVAKAEIVVRNARDVHELPLASLTQPYCAVVPHEVSLEAQNLPAPGEVPAGSGRFVLRPSVSELPICRWSYDLSNALAINRAELTVLQDRRALYPNVVSDERPDWDVRSHTVRFDCNTLELKLQFDRHASASLGFRAGMPVVERQVMDPSGQGAWCRAPIEEKRCRFSWEKRKITLAVDAPIVGYRYSIAYQPLEKGVGFSKGELGFLERLVEACRGEGGSEMVAALTSGIRSPLASVLGGAASPKELFTAGGVWIGSIWKPDERCLVTCFGEFIADSWGVRFPAGTGIAGHAFRIARPAIWHRKDNLHGVLYQRADRPAREYDWIVCLPLLLDWHGPAVATLGLAQTVSSRASGALARLAAVAADPESGKSKAVIRKLVSAANLGFWTILSKEMSGDDAKLAKQVCARLVRVDKVRHAS